MKVQAALLGVLKSIALVLFPNDLGQAAEVTAPSQPSAPNASFSSHLAQLSKEAPQGFTIVSEPPFVVIGDEAPETVQRRAAQTVKWAVVKLKQDYFQRDPDGIIDIWLCKDGSSYTNISQRVCHEAPTSRFGYFSPANQTLIMNIATGSGTLVHEIVHPFIQANFTNCPPWFNEGFASLFEASTERHGHIRGLINWRYKELEKAIRGGKTIPFDKLTSMSAAQFYGGSSYSQHYAQARYLCYYLQEKELLIKFYHEFVAEAKTDPSGFATLKRVLGEKDMEAFSKKWEKFILDFPGP
jgi:hypothetical protein